MKQFEFDWLNQYAGQVALIGFEQYLKHGKGVVEINLKLNSEPKCQYNVYEQLEDYDPNTQTLIKINKNPRQICTHNTDMRAIYGQMMFG